MYTGQVTVEPLLSAWTPQNVSPVYRLAIIILQILGIVTPRAHARSRVKQSILSVSVSVSSVCHQNFGLITTTKGLNTSKRHSNNDNSEKNSA